MSITEKRNRFGMQLLESQLRDNDNYKIIAEGLWNRSVKFLEFPGTKADVKRAVALFGTIILHVPYPYNDSGEWSARN